MESYYKKKFKCNTGMFIKIDAIYLIRVPGNSDL